MVAPNGHVHGIDIVQGLVELSRHNIMKARGWIRVMGAVIHNQRPCPHRTSNTRPSQPTKIAKQGDGDLLQQNLVTLAPTSGWEGAKEHAPYDAIHVGAAAASVPRCVAWFCLLIG